MRAGAGNSGRLGPGPHGMWLEFYPEVWSHGGTGEGRTALGFGIPTEAELTGAGSSAEPSGVGRSTDALPVLLGFLFFWCLD
jgi:hypothetical protein